MKRKSLLFLLLMAMLAPLAAFADELTIANGTSTNNSYVPMYTYYCDYGFKSEYIIPASQLTNLPNGSEITAITLYQAESAAWVAKNLTIKLSNTTTTSYSSTGLLGNSGTTVYTNSSYSANSASSHTFTFNGSSFTYSGGSLIVQISAESGGTYKASTWYGVSQTTNQGYYVYGSSSSSGSLLKFIPKTTFAYTPAGGCSNGCECFENCTALTSTSAGGSGSTPTANLPSNWKGYGASYYPFAAQFTSYMGSDAEGNFMYFKASTDNACFLALPYQYVTEVNFDYAYETNSYGDVLFLEIGYMTDISSSTWYNNTFHIVKTMTNNGATWGAETADFSGISGDYYVVFKFSQTRSSWYSAAIDNVCVTTNAPDPCDKTIPYTYGFEDASDFNCWTTVDCEYDNQQDLSGIVDYLPHSGSNAFYISSYCGNTDPQYLISPKLRGVVNGVHVEFYYRNLQTAPETFQVGYSTTDNNVSSFTWVDSKECTATTYQHFTANYSGDVKYIAVKYTTADSYYLLLDDFTFTEVPSCLEPTNVTASNETTTSATISWTAGGSETEWDLYYTSNPSDVPGASTTPSISGITTTSQNLTSLNPATTYYVYVRAQCTEASAWSVPGIFNTDCEGMALPYFNGFEDGALSVCWTVINDNLVYMNADVADTEPYSGTYHLSLRRGTSNGNQIIVLPEVSSNYALSNYVVSFYARLYAATNTETTNNRTLTVGVMTDPDDPSTFVQVGNAVTPTASYAQYTFDLSSYTGNGQYIAIKHTSTSNGHTFIDNIEVNALPCPVPAGLNVTNLTAATATLNWTGDQNSYNVRYRSYTQGEPQENVFEEGFEGGSMPSGWDNSIYTGSQWRVGAGTGHSSTGIAATTNSATGSYNAYYYNSTSSNSAYLILPALDLSTASVATLTFNYVNPAWSGGVFALTVYYRVNGGSWTELAKYYTSQNTWTEKTVTLTGLADNYEVAFYATGYASDYGHGVGIDDVKITYTAPSINYGEWVTKTNVTSPLNINALTPMADYEWQVQGIDCDGNGGTTDWSAPATFTTLEGYVKHIYNWNTAGYHLISSPIGDVDPEDVTNMIDNTPGADGKYPYDLFRFDQTQALEWRNYRQGAFNLNAGQGYLYANSNDVDLVFTATAYDGDGTFQLVKAEGEGLDFPGWNLVGNPFATEVVEILDGNNNTHSFYTMTADGRRIVSTTNTTVQPMEGVFVVAEVNGEEITFTPVSAKEGSKGSLAALNLSDGNEFVDRAIVRFGQGRQLPKLQLDRNSSKLYIPQDGQDYAVVYSEEMGALPVNFKAENNGTYCLNLSSENVEFAYLHLIDNLTGNDIDLLQTPSYSFEAKTTDYESRFKLVFATGDNSNDDNFAFFSNGSFVINNDGAAELQVIDLMGRILSSETINGCTNVNVNAAPGVYMLRLINGDNVKVQKVVVK